MRPAPALRLPHEWNTSDFAKVGLGIRTTNQVRRGRLRYTRTTAGRALGNSAGRYGASIGRSQGGACGLGLTEEKNRLRISGVRRRRPSRQGAVCRAGLGRGPRGGANQVSLMPGFPVGFASGRAPSGVAHAGRIDRRRAPGGAWARRRFAPTSGRSSRSFARRPLNGVVIMEI